jgi:tRNA A-37 threonylcarbamoyl transferase component Bud32
MFHHWLSHVQRILRGHPNIVYLIDASWSQMPNGMTEAFVLMEFCQGKAGVHCGSRHLFTDLLRVGGGIIDMMNRRLRERLTEAEILTIFVDVCEGVAAMHNLKPALLHRDLKVENILQSSATSYKLCDFGSTAAVARPPSSTQEIRMLEADLNRHTTLQYRAPEMVDAYLRRPIDEKSDVWALGVLLYKLCYYTTPFEEHGPLAILNVQYRIPPYPVYSAQMNALIGIVRRSTLRVVLMVLSSVNAQGAWCPKAVRFRDPQCGAHIAWDQVSLHVSIALFLATVADRAAPADERVGRGRILPSEVCGPYVWCAISGGQHQCDQCAGCSGPGSGYGSAHAPRPSSGYVAHADWTSTLYGGERQQQRTREESRGPHVRRAT